MGTKAIKYICNSCGGIFDRAYGKCPICQSWDRITAEKQPPPSPFNSTFNKSTKTTKQNQFSVPRKIPVYQGDGCEENDNFVTNNNFSTENFMEDTNCIIKNLRGCIGQTSKEKIVSGITEVDRVFGEGLQRGSLILLSGQAGVG